MPETLTPPHHLFIESLVKPDYNLLCRATPKNMIGALLVALHLEEITNLADTHGVRLSQRILKPIRLIHQVEYSACGQPLKAERALIKRSNGREAAVILDPNRAGLLLYYPIGNYNHLIAHRWWNNADTTQVGRPASGPYDRGDVNSRYFFPDNLGFEKAYDTYINTLFDQQMKTGRTTAEVFLSLLPGVIDHPPTSMWVQEKDAEIRQVTI